MWLKTKAVLGHKQCMHILQLLGKEGLHHWGSLCLITHNNNDKEQPDHKWEAFKAPTSKLQSAEATESTPRAAFFSRKMNP